MGLDYALRRRGPLTMAPSQLGLFTRSDPARERANLQFHVQPLSLDKFGDPLHTFPAFTASVVQSAADQPRPRAAALADPATAPVIQPNYLSTDEDRRVAVDSIRVDAADRRAAARSRRYRPDEYLPGPTLPGRRRRRAGAGGRRHRHHHLPPGRHRQDGPRQRPAWRWSTSACASSASSGCA